MAAPAKAGGHLPPGIADYEMEDAEPTAGPDELRAKALKASKALPGSSQQPQPAAAPAAPRPAGQAAAAQGAAAAAQGAAAAAVDDDVTFVAEHKEPVKAIKRSPAGPAALGVAQAAAAGPAAKPSAKNAAAKAPAAVAAPEAARGKSGNAAVAARPASGKSKAAPAPKINLVVPNSFAQVRIIKLCLPWWLICLSQRLAKIAVPLGSN